MKVIEQWKKKRDIKKRVKLAKALLNYLEVKHRTKAG